MNIEEIATLSIYLSMDKAVSFTVIYVSIAIIYFSYLLPAQSEPMQCLCP